MGRKLVYFGFELGDFLVLRLDRVGEGFGLLSRKGCGRGLFLRRLRLGRCDRARQRLLEAGIRIGYDIVEIGARNAGEQNPEGSKQPWNPTA